MSVHPLESLSALLDDELDDAERRDMEAHLAACPACARHLRELTAVDALARGLPPVAAPDGYLAALPGRVRQRIRADRPLFARAPWVWPLAAGLALAVLAPIVLRDGPSRVPPAEDARTAPAVIPPAATAGPLVARRDETRPTVGAEYEADRDARPPARARQDAPRRTAPAAATTPESRAAADTQSAGAMVLRDDARVDEPAFAPPPSAAAGESKQAEKPVRAQGRAAGGVASLLRKSERENTSSVGVEENVFRSIAARPLSTVAEARRARQAWLRFIGDYPRGARVDEARVLLVEASVAAFRDGADPADRIAAQREAEAYLSSPDAPQAARVKAALRGLDDPR